MKVLLLSQSDTGGAAIAARRLQCGLQDSGIDAMMLVRRRSSASQTVVTTPRWASSLVARSRFALDKLPLLAYPNRDGIPFSPQWLRDGLGRTIRRLNPDIVNVHWIGHGYMHPISLQVPGVPIVWTLHDVWPFTGGCHVNLGCTRYEERCGACPQLGSIEDEDLSRSSWRRKHEAWSALDVSLVAPSRWMAESARKSTLFRNRMVHVIPNGLDASRFAPADRIASRRRFDLPTDARLILFAAASGRRVAHKGFDLLEAALDCLPGTTSATENAALVLAGPKGSVGSIRTSFQTVATGILRDEDEMAALYAAVDVTVVPSRQENLPQVAVESLACGTPVVAFDTGGIPDIVDHEQDGYLARPLEADDLARGIQWILADEDRRRRLSSAARAKALRTFDVSRQVERYTTLFEEILEQRKEKHPA